MGRDEGMIDIPRFPPERAPPTGMSRNQSTASPEEVGKQRAIVQAARKELLLDRHIAALAAGAHELTEEQRTEIRQVLRDSIAPLTDWLAKESGESTGLHRDISRGRSLLLLQWVGRDELRDSERLNRMERNRS